MKNKGLSLTRPSAHHLTLIAALLSMIGPFSIDTYLPSFPDIELEFSISRAVLSQSLAVYLLAFAFSTPVLGTTGRSLWPSPGDIVQHDALHAGLCWLCAGKQR